MSQIVTIPSVDAAKPVQIYYCDINGEDCVYVARVYTFPYSFEVPSPYDNQSFTIKIIDMNNCTILDTINITPTPSVTTGLTPTATPSNTRTPTITPTSTTSVTPTLTSTPTNTISLSPTRTPISTLLPNDCVPGTTPSSTPGSTATPTITINSTNTITPTTTITPTVTITPSTSACATCDPMYIWTQYDSTSCYRIDTVPATPPSPGPISLSPKTFTTYSTSGTLFYSNSYNVDGTGTVDVYLTTPAVGGTYTGTLWANPSGNTIDGPLNRCGLWSSATNEPYDTWIGFSVCLSGFVSDKTYYIGIAADNEYRLLIDGVEIFNSYLAPYTGDIFRYWHVYPIVIGGGDHVIELYGLNLAGPASFGCEIYDNTLAELTGFTSYSELNVIFTSSGQTQVTIVQDTSGNYLSSGYTCPSGYVYSDCDGTCSEYIFCPSPTPTVTPTTTLTSTPTMSLTPTSTITPTPTTTPITILTWTYGPSGSLTDSDSSLANLDVDELAVAQDTTDLLTKYQVSLGSFNQIGNSYSISGIGGYKITKLTTSRIAMMLVSTNTPSTVCELRAYDFDGTDWAQVGSSLTVPNYTNGSICNLSSSRVVIIGDVDNNLLVYDFNGSSWSQVGNAYSIVTTNPQIAALTSSRIALSDGTTLTSYNFDGTNWSQFGTPGTTYSSLAIASFSSDLIGISYIDYTYGPYWAQSAYSFNGATWIQNSIKLIGSGQTTFAMAPNTSTSVFSIGSGQIWLLYLS